MDNPSSVSVYIDLSSKRIYGGVQDSTPIPVPEPWLIAPIVIATALLTFIVMNKKLLL